MPKIKIKYLSTAHLSYFIVIFGFYIGFVRTDQLFVYAYSLVIFFVSGVTKFKIRELSVLSLIVLFITIGIIASVYHFNNRPVSLFISQLENYLSLFAIYYIWIKDFKYRSIWNLILIQKIFIYTMAFVSILILISKIFSLQIPSIFHSGIVTQRSDMMGMKLIDIAVASGRNPGVFGQVFEAGVAFGIAFLSLIVIRKYFSRQYIFLSLLFFILLGGIFSGSKIFFFSVISIIIFISFRSWKVLFVFLVLTLSFYSYFYLYNLELPWQFKRLITNITWSNFYHIYTSFRFANDSMILIEMKEIFSENPLGLGFGYLDNSDFSLYEVLSIAGTIGIMIYIMIILVMYYEAKTRKELFINCFIMFFLATASIAAPVITANKIGFIIMISFLSLKRIVSER